MALDIVQQDQPFHPSSGQSGMRQPSPDDVLGGIGSLQVRLIRNARELAAAQRLRYRVFAEEMKANLPAKALLLGRDFDRFDDLCDHLVVLDGAIGGEPEDRIIGTYRLLRDDVARAQGGFYSASEFDIAPLLARHPDKRFMELGRSCVLPDYRHRRTVELLWLGIWAYAQAHRIDVLFGCASLPGIVPEEHALALSFLPHHASARGEWRVGACVGLFRTMDLMPVEAVNVKRALLSMPPLLKAYVRLGASIGHGAVVDTKFGTTDVLVIMPVNAISGRYLHYYRPAAGRFCA